MEYFCNCCKVLILTESEKEQHCKTERHQVPSVTDEERVWKHRRFPVSSLPESWSICPKYQSTGSCTQGSCEKAHGESELNEWKARWNYRRRKLQKAKQSFSVPVFPVKTPENLLNGHQDETCEDVYGVRIDVTPELNIIIPEEKKSMMWTFNVVTQMHLTQISLRRSEDRDDFYINEVTILSEDCNQPSSLERGNVVWKNPREPDESQYRYTCGVIFTTHFSGIFFADVVFQFVNGPFLIKELEIRVVTKEDFTRFSLVREEIEDFNQRYRGRDITSVTFENRSHSNAGKSVTPPISLYSIPFDSKYFTPDILQRPNEENYKGRMHQILQMEEIQQQTLISRYHCVTRPESLHPAEAPLEPSNIGERNLQEGEVFVRFGLSRDLTEDTDEGRLMLKNCDTLLLAPFMRSPHEKKVYEAIIKGKQKRTVSARLSRTCVEDLRWTSFLDFEVQFQLRAAPFCEMHMAIDKLQPVSLVFPDVNIIPQRPCAASQMKNYVSPQLNLHQRNAVLTITVPLSVKLPPIVIAGPFGTGKSFTIFEAAKLLVRDPSNRLLICTHSNSAADAYIANYFHPYNTDHPEATPLRLYHYKQKIDSLDPVVQKYCVRNESRGRMEITMPGKEYVSQYRVVVTNLRTSRYLTNIGIEKGYFTHIFIDNAAQALECEAIIPLGLATEETRIVLAGDLQATPKVYSSFARECGFDVSLLRRLWDSYPCNFPCKFALSHNYTSHEAIVKFASTEFYGNINLSAESNQPLYPNRYSLCFFSVRPDEVQDHKAVGNYNLREVKAVVSCIEELKKSWPENWGAQDDSSIAVFTPYYDQTVRIRKELRQKNLGNVFVGKIGNAQGRHFRVVLLSTVVSSKSFRINGMNEDCGFLSNTELFRSAVSRARSLIVVVGNHKLLCAVGNCRYSWRQYLVVCKQKQSFRTFYEPPPTRESSANCPELNPSNQEVLRSECPSAVGLAPQVSHPTFHSFPEAVSDAPSSENASQKASVTEIPFRGLSPTPVPGSAPRTPDVVLSSTTPVPGSSRITPAPRLPPGTPVAASAPRYPSSSSPVLPRPNFSSEANLTQESSTERRTERDPGRSNVVPTPTARFSLPQIRPLNEREIQSLESFLPRFFNPKVENFTTMCYSSPETRVVNFSTTETPSCRKDTTLAYTCFDPRKKLSPSVAAQGTSSSLNINIPFFTPEGYERAYIELFRESESSQRDHTAGISVTQQARLGRLRQRPTVPVYPELNEPSMEEKMHLLRSRVPSKITLEEFRNCGIMQEKFYYELYRSKGICMAKRFLHYIHSIRKRYGFENTTTL